ncbi:hypothetical protein BJ165DRAFT_838165 [Panaeolus papilionaceus]|nr:hypothetical protein BJ165DRAFT_838165 [Panaeolus papilionaceus]
MATTFSAFASQYLNRQHASTLSSSSQPMFFSFTSDAESHHGRHDPDLDDLDDPHLRGSDIEQSREGAQDDEDPYLRLDEDEHVGKKGFDSKQQQQQSIPLIARSPSPDSPPGWLAHLAHSPQRRRSPSPSPSSSSSDSGPPADLMVASPPTKSKTQRAAQQVRVQPPHPAHPLNPPRTAHSLSLTDSLLPRDGRSRPLDVFSLPDPRHTSRARRKYHEPIWISVWLGLVLFILLFTIVILFTTTAPTKMPKMAVPYYVLLRTVPMLIILTCTSALVAYAHVYLLRIFVKPVMIATSVFIPATLLLSAIWAFIGSFMWEEGVTPTWGETVGLRLFALIPLTLAFITGRRLMHLPRSIHVTSSTLTLTTHLLISNPFLLGLSPAILICALIGSIPFATLTFRLLLHGYGTKDASGWEWHVQAWANWSIFGTVSVWLWSWAVARGVLRMTCASVIGAWYFADPAVPPPPPSDTNIIHAAITRATGPSFGSIIVASLILTIMRMLAITVLLLRRLPPLLLRIPWVPLSVPIALYVVPGIRWLVIFLEEKTGRLSRYALIYVGLTGAGFWEGATRGVALVSVAGGTQWGIEEEEEEEESQDNRGRRTRNNRPRNARLQRKKFGMEPPLAMLTISPLTLTFPFALITYLFVAHTLGAPKDALGAALLAAGVTALVGLFCVGLVKDANSYPSLERIPFIFATASTRLLVKEGEKRFSSLSSTTKTQRPGSHHQENSSVNMPIMRKLLPFTDLFRLSIPDWQKALTQGHRYPCFL